jgi:hypothetical protein
MFDSVLLHETRNLLEKLKPEDLPEGTYLGGGTAVALYLGHLRSADLDFFTSMIFEEKQWEKKLNHNMGLKLLKRDWQTLIGYIDQVKISIFGCQYPQIGVTELYQRIPVASLPDMGAMKLDTLIGRRTKRDFIDVYFLAHRYTLAVLFSFYQQKYGNFEERKLLLKKSLVYFADADKEEIPYMLKPVNWPDIKKWFITEIKTLNNG